MMRSLRFWVLAASVAALAACLPARTAPTASTPASVPEGLPTPEATRATVTGSVGGLTFERPASWVAWKPNEHVPWIGGPMLYLSTDPLLPACAVAPSASPNPPDASGFACPWPLRELKPGGVLAIWWATRPPRPLPTVGGTVVETNGAKARWSAVSPGECSPVGADETITGWVPIGQPLSLSNTAFTACLRGPGLEATEAAVRALLASARQER